MTFALMVAVGALVALCKGLYVIGGALAFIAFVLAISSAELSHE